MNKREALRACLDGKKVAHPNGRIYAFDGCTFRFSKDGHEWTLDNPVYWNDDNNYELYVEPPKEVTRAEAWAALDEGKVVRADVSSNRGVQWLFRCTAARGLEVALSSAPDFWSTVQGSWGEAIKRGAKFYILEGEP